MKYVRTFESFRNNNKDGLEQVNEEFLGKLFNWIGKKWGEWGKSVAATKGGKEIEVIYQKYMKILNDEMSRKAGVDLNIMSGDKLAEIVKKKGDAPKTGAKPGGKPVENIAQESYRVFEAEEKQPGGGESDAQKEKNTKLTVDTLKKKSELINQLIEMIQKRAKNEMFAVLKKNGGASNNPKLAAIINAKIEQFEFDVLQAKIKYLEESGDTTMLPNLVKERDAMSKKIEATYKNIQGLQPVKYQKGMKAIYLLKGKTLDDWYALSEEDRKDPESEKSKKVVGVKSIVNIEGKGDQAVFTFATVDGKEFTKDSTEIMGKAPGDEQEPIKVGDTVTWKKKDKEGNETAESITKEVEDVKDNILTFSNKAGDKYTKNRNEVTKVTPGEE
jgi:hypothetical protein